MNESSFRSRVRRAIGESDVPPALSSRTRLALQHAGRGRAANFQWIAGSVAVVLAIAVIAGLLAVGNLGRSHTVTPNPATTTPSPSPSQLPAMAVSLGAITDLAVSPSAVYALYVPAGTQGPLAGADSTMVARIDRQSLAVTSAGPFPGAFRIAVGAGAVWIGGSTLVKLDPVSLSVLARTTLPAEAQDRPATAQVAAGSAGVWVAYGTHLYEIDPATGSPSQTRSLTGFASSIALTPSGARLYVGTDAVGTITVASIVAFDTATLNQVASSATGGASLGGPSVAASDTDVWVAYATGTLGLVEHRRATDLGPLPSPSREFSNGVQVYVAGGIVWVTDGAGTLGCLDPQSGALSWSQPVPLGAVVAGDDSSVYVGGSTGVDTLTPGPGCTRSA